MAFDVSTKAPGSDEAHTYIIDCEIALDLSHFGDGCKVVG